MKTLYKHPTVRHGNFDESEIIKRKDENFNRRWKTSFNFILNFLTAYAILHFITMAALPVIWINSYVYSTEIFAPKWRIVFIGVFEIPIGYYIFGLIAYLNRTWTGIHIWVGIATALTLPLYFILPESPRDHP